MRYVLAFTLCVFAGLSSEWWATLSCLTAANYFLFCTGDEDD
jgi:hypothetical protein